jgi:DNA-binding SARP family transcriptional activator/tetratricopeptide (TPR) repeat protein
MTAAPARLRLLLLGGFQARRRARPVALPSRKARALLAFLATHPDRAHSRERLAALLWTDSPEAKARNSLRQTLFALRRAFGAGGASPLRVEADAVALAREGVETDVAEFERLVAAGGPADLARAAALYRGELLEGLALDEGPFEDWLRPERERLRAAALDGLRRLLARQTATGALAGTIQTATRLLAIDPTQEAAHRTLMRLYARQGRRAAALRQYADCVAVLRREAGAEPEPETTALHEALVAAGAGRGGAEAPGRAPRAGAPPLVGRGPELALLREALREAGAGRGRLVIIVGEAGIGKSRLVDEVLAEATRRGARRLVGRAHATTQVLPFGPWIDALRDGAVVEDRALTGLALVWRAELARLLPEVGGAGPAQAALPAAADSAPLFEAVAQLLGHLARRRPLVLALEDLHWADDLSVRLLAFAGRRMAAGRALLLATAREEDLAVAPVLRTLLHEGEREARVTQVVLPSLSRADTDRLVEALMPRGGGRAALARAAERVWELSGGNPFVAVETTRALAGRPSDDVEVPVPPRVRDVIVERLERLSPRGRRLVAAAAVLGAEFDTALLGAITGLGAFDVVEGLDELLAQRVFRAVRERLDFGHERVREVAYALLAVPAREALHAAAAQALEAAHAAALDAVADRLAHHWARTAEPGRAVVWLVRLARRALQSHAHADALAALEEARARADRLPEHERARAQAEIALERARVLSSLGRLHEARDALLAEVDRVARLETPRLAGRAHFLLGNTLSLLGDADGAETHARRALGQATASADTSTAGKAHFVLALEGFWSGRLREGVTHGEEAVRLLAPRGRDWWVGLVHWVLGFNHTLLGEFRRALDAEAQARAIGAALGDPRLVSSADWTTGGIHALAGEAKAALEACRRGLEASPGPLGRAIARGWLGYAALVDGDAPQAIALLEEAVAEYARFRFRAHGWFLAWLAEAHLAARDRGRAGRLAAEGLASAGAARQRYGIGIAQRVLGEVALAAGDRAAAAGRLEESLATFRAIDARFEAGRTLLALARLGRARGAGGEEARRADEARGLFAALGLPAWEARAGANR